jgi:hypothetical protein
LVSFSSSDQAVRINTGSAGGTAVLAAEVQGSEPWVSLLVTATVKATSLEDQDSCTFEVSTDGGQTWQSDSSSTGGGGARDGGGGGVVLVTLTNGMEGTFVEASAVVSKPNPFASVCVRLAVRATGDNDNCFLRTASVQPLERYVVLRGRVGVEVVVSAEERSGCVHSTASIAIMPWYGVRRGGVVCVCACVVGLLLLQ